MSQANRGMALENLLNYTNEVYLQKGVAVVHKRPTPVKITQTKGTRILSGFLESKSTVDYCGVYSGRALEFEAKSTKESNRFPLDNIHEHQVQHMRLCARQGAVVFVVMEFSKHDETFYVPAKLILDAWDHAQNGGRKSITYQDISTICYLIKPGRGVPLDYLRAVDEHIRQKAV